MNPHLKGLARLGLSTGLLLLLFLLLDAGEIARQLRSLDLVWALAGVLVLIVQVLLLTWRWRFTAQRLQLPMSYRHALREYYLGVFLNQLLPGGILGDISRAWRHARASARTRTAVHAVVLERIGVQAAMFAMALASLLAIPALRPTGTLEHRFGIGLLALAGLSAATWLLYRRSPRLRAVIAEFGADARRTFLPAPMALTQVGSAVLVVTANLAGYIAAVRALGLEIPLDLLLPLIAPVLLMMMLPISIAGWGVREGAAALLWSLAGLDPAEAVAAAIVFGLLFLLAALPGGLALAGGLMQQTRDRTTRRRPA